MIAIMIDEANCLLTFSYIGTIFAIAFNKEWVCTKARLSRALVSSSTL